MTDHAALLETLARAEPDALKTLASELLPGLGRIEVIASRSGLVMVPMRDTAQGTDFHLGEVLVAEAHIRLTDCGIESYGLIPGTDLERAMAMAVLDGAHLSGRGRDAVAQFAQTQARAQADADRETLRRIEATRVEMETF